MFKQVYKKFIIIIVLLLPTLSNASSLSCNVFFKIKTSEHWSTEFFKTNDIEESLFETHEILDIKKNSDIVNQGRRITSKVTLAFSALKKSFQNIVHSSAFEFFGNESRINLFLQKITAKSSLRIDVRIAEKTSNTVARFSRINGKKVNFWDNPVHQETLKGMYLHTSEVYRKRIEYSPEHPLASAINDLVYTNFNVLIHRLVTVGDLQSSEKNKVSIRPSQKENLIKIEDIFEQKLADDMNQIKDFDQNIEFDLIQSWLSSKLNSINNEAHLNEKASNAAIIQMDIEVLMEYHRYLYIQMQSQVDKNIDSINTKVSRQKLIELYQMTASQSALNALFIESELESMAIYNRQQVLKHKPIRFTEEEFDLMINDLVTFRTQLILTYLKLYEVYSI